NSPVAATFKSPAQVDIGTVQVDETPSGMRLRLHLRGLTPGWHAMHVHENGKCGTADFADAGGHLGHDHAAHGRMSP
ncbi:superoxide dismutase family protein, partial [Acinetobacter baumannii]